MMPMVKVELRFGIWKESLWSAPGEDEPLIPPSLNVLGEENHHFFPHTILTLDLLWLSASVKRHF